MKSFIASLCFIVFIHTAQAQQFATQKGGHCYTLDVPNYLKKTFSLNDVASLQYMNEDKVAFCVVIDDNKEHLAEVEMNFTGVKNFLENFLEDYNTEAADRKVGSITEFTANNNKHAQTELTWTEEGDKFYLLVTAVETKTHYYKILTWTIAANKDELKNDFIKIAKSLKD